MQNGFVDLNSWGDFLHFTGLHQRLGNLLLRNYSNVCSLDRWGSCKMLSDSERQLNTGGLRATFYMLLLGFGNVEFGRCALLDRYMVHTPSSCHRDFSGLSMPFVITSEECLCRSGTGMADCNDVSSMEFRKLPSSIWRGCCMHDCRLLLQRTQCTRPPRDSSCIT